VALLEFRRGISGSDQSYVSWVALPPFSCQGSVRLISVSATSSSIFSIRMSVLSAPWTFLLTSWRMNHHASNMKGTTVALLPRVNRKVKLSSCTRSFNASARGTQRYGLTYWILNSKRTASHSGRTGLHNLLAQFALRTWKYFSKRPVVIDKKPPNPGTWPDYKAVTHFKSQLDSIRFVLILYSYQILRLPSLRKKLPPKYCMYVFATRCMSNQ
jgi:hypothetical protein